MSELIRLYTDLSPLIPTCILGDELSDEIGVRMNTGDKESGSGSLLPGQRYAVIYAAGSLYFRIAPFSGKGNRSEHFRLAGAHLWTFLKEQNISAVQVDGGSGEDQLHFAEGLALKDYRFEVYKAKKSAFKLANVTLSEKLVKTADVQMLMAVIHGIIHARDLVNEPANVLTARELANRITAMGKETGFKTEVFGKAKLQALKMGGLLSVNLGSSKEPTFSILEYRHPKAQNKKPIVLVGKGIVYDTGGLSLKPTPNSMDMMKCDMAGAAAVAGIFAAVASAKLPLHLIGLIPATDNHPGPDAYAPGDVITMFDATTVEVMNTDAEGRLVLADALAYAKKYDPDLVFDFATLTGSAINALGTCAAPVMGTAADEIFKDLEIAGSSSYERTVRFPLWDDYAQGLESEIADIKNLGSSPLAGSIEAGKFLERFTDYPWVHFDIAGPAFLPAAIGYLPKGGTGFGVKLMYEYLKERTQ